MRNCWRTQHWPFYLRLFGIWNKLERWESLVSGYLMSWLQIKKNHRFEVLSYSMQQQTISQLDCDMQWKVDFIRQPAMASSVAGLRSTKALPEANSHLKKGHGQFDGLLPVWSTTAFWIPAKLLHPYIQEACSANRWDAPKTALPAAGIGQRREPIFSPWQCPTARGTTNASKVERVGLWSFATFTWPLANGLPLLQASWQLFAGKMRPQPAGGGKCFPIAHQMPKHRFLC